MSALDKAMQDAWQFVKPTILEQSKEDGLAGVWAKAFRSGWDAQSRDCFADGIRAAASLFTTDPNEPVDDLTKLTREAIRQRILSLITSPPPQTNLVGTSEEREKR